MAKRSMYRIVKRRGWYYAQRRCWPQWCGWFVDVGGIQQTENEARRYIEYLKRCSEPQTVVHEE